MSDKLQAAMEAAVANALPKTQADLLQKRLAEADSLEQKLETAEKTNDGLVKDITKLTKERDAANTKAAQAKEKAATLKEREEAVTARELEADKRERGFEMELMKKELELIKGNNSTVLDLTKTVFRNHVVRENVLNYKDQPGQYITVQDAFGIQHQQWIPTGPPHDNGGTTTRSKEDEPDTKTEE